MPLLASWATFCNACSAKSAYRFHSSSYDSLIKCKVRGYSLELVGRFWTLLWPNKKNVDKSLSATKEKSSPLMLGSLSCKNPSSVTKAPPCLENTSRVLDQCQLAIVGKWSGLHVFVTLHTYCDMLEVLIYINLVFIAINFSVDSIQIFPAIIPLLLFMFSHEQQHYHKHW